MKWFARFFLVTLFFVLLFPLLTPVSAQFQSRSILITGRVTSEDNGAPLANVSIQFTNGLDTGEVARTDSSGYYTVTQTLLDSWQIIFKPTDEKHIAEYYDNVTLPDGSKAVVFNYEPGMMKSGIDAALAVKGQGQIRGLVTTGADKKPLAGVYVEVYDSTGRLENEYTYSTDSSGAYTVTDLAAGGYKLQFNPIDTGEFYAFAYSGGALNLAAAQVVQVGNGEVVEGMNASLGAGGVITGFVHTNLGSEIAVPLVSVYDKNGQQVSRGSLCSGEKCTYTVTNLPPGDYRLFFREGNNTFRPSYYNGQSTLDQAQPVTVRAGVVTPNINEILTYTPVIISLATSKNLPGVLVVGKTGDPLPYISMDDGHTWQHVPTSPLAQHQGDFLFDIAHPNVALAPRAGLAGQRILVGYGDHMLYGGGEFYRSGDNGQTWAQIQPEPCAKLDGSSVVVPSFSPWFVSPVDPSHIYFIKVCGYEVGENAAETFWLTKSTDGGVTWQAISLTGVFPDLYNFIPLVPSPVLADRLYYRTFTNFSPSAWSESDDNGETWQDRDFPVAQLTLDAQNANELYGWQVANPAPTHLPVGVRSEDGGKHWAQWAQQPCTPVDGELWASPFQSKLLFIHCDFNFGYFRSEDGGDSWKKLSPINGQLWVADYSHPGRLLLAKANTGELWQSLDKGDSWQLLMSGDGTAGAQNRVPLYLPSITTHGP